MTENQIKKLVSKQREYFHSGATLSYEQRIKALKKLRTCLNRYEKEIYEALKIDLNKPKMESYFTEIVMIMTEIKLTLKKLKKWLKPKRVKPGFINFASQATIQQEPYGVSLIISPWNYPLQLAIAPLVGAISGGNTAILKTSELAPATSKLIKKMLTETFKEEYISVVEGKVKEATLLLEQKFDFIFFTGSTPVGKIVMQAAAKHLTPVVLELGGKSPCIIGKTADLKTAAKKIAWGKLINAGQTCIAPDYLYIHESRKDEFIEAYIKQIKHNYGDDSANSNDYCKIINARNFKRLQSLIGEAKVIQVGKENLKTLHFPPTIVDNLNSNSPLLKEEIFGPILPIVTFRKKGEIPAYIRKTGKPLALYIFTEDKNFSYYLLKNTSSGGVCINDTISHITSENLPFGGVGESGSGSYHGKQTFLAFTHAKSILTKRGIDPPIKFPPYKKTERWIKRMKRLLMIVCMFVALSPAKGFSSPYKNFHKKLKAKSYNSALRTIRSLYNRETHNEKYKYWYGYTLYKAKKYKLAIKIFKSRPHDYRPLSRAYHLANAYEKTKQYRRGINFLKKALKLEETRPGYLHYFYSILVRMIIKTKNTSELDRLLPSALKYYNNYQGKSKNPSYFFYKVGRFFLDSSLTAIKKKQWKKGFNLYKKCLPYSDKNLDRYHKYLRPVRFSSSLLRKKRYKDVIKSFNLLSKKDRTIRAKINRISAIFALGKKKQAVSQIKALIIKQGKRFLASDWWYTVVLLNKSKQLTSIIKIEKMVKNAYRKEKKTFPVYLRYRFTGAWLNRIYNLVGKGKDRKALRTMKQVFSRYKRGVGKYKKYLKIDQVKFLQKALRYWVKNRYKIKNSYKHKFLITVFSDSNVKFKNLKGKRVHIKDHIPKSQIALYKNSLQTLRRVYYYLTRSQVDMAFDFKYLKSTITKVYHRTWTSQLRGRRGKSLEQVDYFHPVLESIQPSPSKLFYKNRNKYDTFLLVFPSKGITRTSNGGRTRIPFLPNSKVLRGRIIIAGASFSDSSYRLLSHEFFHATESAYHRNYPYPAHVWRKQYKHKWPSWYRGETELEYYEMAFKHFFRPNGIRKLNFKAKRDISRYSQFQGSQATIQRTGYNRKADKTDQSEGDRAYKKGRYYTASRLYKIILKGDPNDRQLLKKIVACYSKMSKYKQMKEYYIRAAALPGASRKEKKLAKKYKKDLHKLKVKKAARIERYSY